MRDLYKRLGLRSREVSQNAIATAIDRCQDADVATAARHILLNEKRKAVYDRNHAVLETIAQLRSMMQLNDFSGAHGSRSVDFRIVISPLERGRPNDPRMYWVRRLAFLGAMILLFAIVGVVMRIVTHDSRTNRAASNRSYPVAGHDGVPRSQSTPTPTPQVSQPELRDAPRARFTPTPTRQLNQLEPIPLRLPENGTLVNRPTAPAVAPFEIRTRSGSGHYFVKLVDLRSQQTVVSIFVREGMTAETEVPLGQFELRYAVGRRWYGTEGLFGPSTSCARAPEPIVFTENERWVTGHTIELFLQPNGNLSTEPIEVDEF